MKRLAASAAAMGASAIALSAAAFAQTSIEIDEGAPIGTIQPEVYGQFLEHLGAQIYDGFWVGEDSDIPNTDGIRDDAFEALDNLQVPVIRWPGGCFADIYHWREGVGERTSRANMAWGGTPEPNTFGTHEFFNLAERLGAKTYLNVNLATGTPQEAGDWLEYITGNGDTALANERRANGRTEPWKIDYLSIGNETWGCGGNMRADFYADLYAQWATLLKTVGEQPVRIISGSHDGNIGFSDEVLDHRAMRGLAEGISVHYYTLPTRDWGDKGEGLGFGEDMWASTLKNTLHMEQIIDDQLAMIDSHPWLGDDFDLYPDEWGVWVNTPEGAPALWQQNTIREALVAALNFNIFHEHADRIPMTNIAQMVNVLQAMILIEGEDMVLTPTYHAFEMYTPFQGASALPVSLDGPTYSHGDVSFPALSASAALTEGGDLVVALVNADAGKAHEVSVPVGKGRVSARMLTGDTLDAHNDFGTPEAVRPEAVSVRASNGTVTMDLPPRSITVLTVDR